MNAANDRLPSELIHSLYRRHRQGALVRSGGALFMWIMALLNFWIADLKPHHFWGVTGAVAYLILINPPTLFFLKRASAAPTVQFLSLLINFLEIAGYTAVMYFLGGIEATYLTPIYGIVIFYVGITAPRRYPFFVASFCAVCFVPMALAQLIGWLPAQNVIPHFYMPLKREIDILFVVLGLLFLTAFAASYTSTILKKQRDRIQRQKEELEAKVGERTVELRELNGQMQEELLQRRETEKKLRTSEENFRRIFENSFDVIYTLDTQAKILSVSPSVKSALGYEPEELVGKSIVGLDIIAPESMELAYRNALKVFSGESIQGGEYQFIDRHGNRKYAETSGAPLFQEEKVVGLMSIARDITERKKAEEERVRSWQELERRVQERTKDLAKARLEAEAASRAKSEFLANMSHELRTPLNHIIGFTELVVDGQVGELSEVQKEYLGDVLGSSRHLLSLINDILDLSKVEAGKLRLEVGEVILPPLLRNSFTMVKEKSLKRVIELRTEIDGIPEKIQGDERKLRQILYNLLSNAVKFTPDGGVVTLSAGPLVWRDHQWMRGDRCVGSSPFAPSVPGKWVEISIRDTGIGVKAQDLERIFTPFEQADNSATRRYQGTGLGLSLTRKLVELHGGKIWAESEGEGKGSNFVLVIPENQTNKSAGE